MNRPRASERDLEPRSRWPIRLPAGRGGEPSSGSRRGSYLATKTPPSSGRSLPQDSSSTCITQGAGFGHMDLGAGNTVQSIAWRQRQGGKASQLRDAAMSPWPPGRLGAKRTGDPPRSCAARARQRLARQGELGCPCAAPLPPHPRPRLGLPRVRPRQRPGAGGSCQAEGQRHTGSRGGRDRSREAAGALGRGGEAGRAAAPRPPACGWQRCAAAPAPACPSRALRAPRPGAVGERPMRGCREGAVPL